ncbi:AGAP010323-PA [Anopheles gambiae str. PEST]|uniref:AGAP010323-PA n=2 Tax=gambiae species complex TaxID=44542 RepID=A0NFJ9_ANOGA|nr:AGAP010323-PA [Anopheles gambiae str. PEST]
MPHAIVQTTDARGNGELHIVPEGWIQETNRGKSYYLWPKTNVIFNKWLAMGIAQAIPTGRRLSTS